MAYKQSDDTEKYKKRWEEYYSSRPADWNGGTYGTEVKSLYDQYKNYKPFQYDVNTDQLYQQYKNQYIQQGKLAMQDTVGQASALTGGYGNSYATTAGSQAYQQYLSQLNDKVPELYSLALSKYNQDKSDLYNTYGMASDLYSKEYGEWGDKMSQWNTDVSREYGYYKDSDSDDYSRYNDTVSTALSMNDFDTLDSLGYNTDNLRASYNASLYSGGGTYDTEDTEDTEDTTEATEGKYKFSKFKTDDFGEQTGMASYYNSETKKYEEYAIGTNPYTNSVNSDVKTNGKYDSSKAFSNGYQPNNVGGKKLSKTEGVNGQGLKSTKYGRSQNVYRTSDGTMYVWDGQHNLYTVYTNEDLDNDLEYQYENGWITKEQTLALRKKYGLD